MKMRGRMKKHTLKFVSFFLAIFLWIYVLNSEKIKFEKTVNLEYILPVDMIFAQKPPSEGTFIIYGPRAFVRTVTERKDSLVIDLNKANPRRQLQFVTEINPDLLELPLGMIVEKVLPRKIAVKLENKASKIVPLKIQFGGYLPDKFRLHSAYLEPAEVEVYGPRSLISKIKELPIKAIELANLPGLNQIPVEVNLPDDRLNLISGLDVKLFYELKASTGNFILNDVPIQFTSNGKKIISAVKTADLKLLVSEKVTKSRSNISSSVEVWADIPMRAKGRIEVPLKVVLPASIHLLEVSPKSIIVNVQ